MKPKGMRHLGRRLALQTLYSYDVCDFDNQTGTREVNDDFDLEGKRPEIAFGDNIVSFVCGHLPAIDDKIEQSQTRWRIARMSRVDRTILRMAVAEMMMDKAPPVAVVIDEAVELAKTFGAETSARFVNGILDEIAKRHE